MLGLKKVPELIGVGQTTPPAEAVKYTGESLECVTTAESKDIDPSDIAEIKHQLEKHGIEFDEQYNYYLSDDGV